MMTEKELINRLDSFYHLKQNWDSYEAEPINPASIELAKQLVPGLPREVDWHVVPGPDDGGVQFESTDGESQIDVWVKRKIKREYQVACHGNFHFGHTEAMRCECGLLGASGNTGNRLKEKP